VLPDSPAAAAGVQVGDVIFQVNQTPVGSAEELQKEAGKVTGNRPLLVLLRRADGHDRFATLTTE
jgi:C-terminal processing protease CtpA/Prc